MTGIRRYKPEVAAALTEDFRRGGPKPELGEYLEVVEDLVEFEGHPLEVDLGLVRDLIHHALEERFPDPAAKDHIRELDAWLATRLHYCLRLPRRIAADRGVWAWLAIEAGERYVLHRWGAMKDSADDTVTAWRFTGPLLRNGLSRLWWGAEMVRNGPSYEYVRPTFARVRTAQWVLELKYSWYRPAPIAFVRVAEGLDGSRTLADDEMRALSTQINAYLSLTALEAVGIDEADDEKDQDWLSRVPTLQEAVTQAELKGPEDGRASEEAIRELEMWFRRIAEEPSRSARRDASFRSPE